MGGTKNSKTDHLNKLTEIIQKAARGDYATPADFWKRDDELGPLTQAIKCLIDRLQEETSAHKTAERAFHKTLDKYQRLEANIPGMVYTFALHPDGSYSLPYVTPASRELFGLGPEEAMRDWDRIYNLVHAEDRAKLDQSIKISAETLQPWRELLRFIINREVRWYDCMSRPEPQPKGDILWEGIVLDITERKQAEERLRLQAMVLDQIEDRVTVTDFEGIISYVNDAECRALKRSREDMLGRSVELYGEDPARGATQREIIEKTRLEGEWRGEVVNYAADGTDLVLDCRTRLVRDDSGRPVAMCGIATDITERKRMEDELRATKQALSDIIEFLPDATFVIDNDKKVIAWNRAIEEMTGVSKKDMIGQGNYAYTIPFYGERRKHLVDLLDADDAELRSRYKGVQKKGNTLFAETFAPALYKGKGAYVFATVAPLFDMQGRRAGAIESIRDITERKRAEEKLRESEERFRQLAEVFPETIFEADLNGNLTYVNAHGLQRFGFNREDFERGLNVVSLIAPADVERVMQRVQDRLAGKTGSFTEYRPRCKNGETFDALALSAPIFREGSIAGFRGFILDITERKRAEEALRESEERFRSTFEQAAVGMAHIAPDFRYQRVNKKLCDIVGYTEEELRSKTFFDLTHPDDRPKNMAMHEEMVSGKCDACSLEKRYLHKNGSMVWVNISVASVKSPSGEEKYYATVVEDISARKAAEERLRESEERFRHLAELLPEGIYELDLQGKITYANRSALEQFGYSTSDLAKGLGAFDVVVPAQRETAKENARKVLQGGTVTLSEYTGLRKDGSTFPVVMHSAPVVRDERIVGARGMCVNMTERKHLEAQLVQAQKMESVGRLAGGVAHDFNNMLAVILGSAELIKVRLNDDDPLLDHVLEIEKAAYRSKDITSQLLAFSRKQIIAPKPVNLNELIPTVEKTLSRLIGEDIDLRFRPGKDIWKINLDPSQVDQILINLVVNARDAMPHGGKLVIETGNVELDEAFCLHHPGATPGAYVILRVTDNGAGMDEEILAHLFEPFFTTKEIGKGTGLGLATVYGIVKQNNGFIDVVSRLGRGATFEIYLPRLIKQDERIEAAFEKTPEGCEIGTILLVEDNAMVRSVSTEILETAGHRVLAVATPEEALKLCEESSLQIDLLLTDVVLPGMSGKELKDKLDATRPGVNALFMSGYPADVIAHHGVLEPGTNFIPKPFTIDELRKSVQEAMRKRVKQDGHP